MLVERAGGVVRLVVVVERRARRARRGALAPRRRDLQAVARPRAAAGDGRGRREGRRERARAAAGAARRCPRTAAAAPRPRAFVALGASSRSRPKFELGVESELAQLVRRVRAAPTSPGRRPRCRRASAGSRGCPRAGAGGRRLRLARRGGGRTRARTTRTPKAKRLPSRGRAEPPAPVVRRRERSMAVALLKNVLSPRESRYARRSRASLPRANVRNGHVQHRDGSG